jgi:hypothetical protein
MKKSILVWALTLIIGLNSSFAGTTTEISEKVTKSFQKEFAGAQNVQWEQGKDFVRATFTQNEQVMFAYFNPDGDLLAVTRNILAGQLPINLFTDVKKSYGGFWITELFELAMNNETSYYITLQNGDQKVILKSNGTNGWEVFKKEKKEII